MLDFAGRRVVILGDVMLDRFLYGEVPRLSPEAPVPVVRLGRIEAMPGGAGNVARNVAALGGEPRLVALCGEDAAGAELGAMLGEMARLVVAPGRVTTTKLRVIAARQQVVRVDEERATPADEVEAARLLALLGEEMSAAEVLVLSDYAKGTLTPPVIAAATGLAAARGIACLVDPKGRDFARYAGATLLTPNAPELAEATGRPVGDDAACESAARELLARIPLGALLVTRSEKGMMLIPRDAPVASVPAMAREVFDVSGAGDTALAALALATASGFAPSEAMRVANAAAGVVVGKLGTATCSAAELDHALREQEGATGEVLPWPMAERLVAGWRAAGLCVGFANGCFDVLHAGHVQMLRAARRHCDRLVVALNDDASVARLKGATRPINPLADRAAVIGALAAVDAVIAFAEDTPLEAIRALRPDRLFKGEDYALDQVVGASEVASWGGETVLLPLLPGRSTTGLVARARGGA
jgi:D-beta-D-heptose 7-phosphate kinase/D-beta-D-heptose 1-phosphate adenosyltransferase